MTKNQLKSNIKNELASLLKDNFINLFLIGSTIESHAEHINDIDFVCIVSDSVSTYNLTKQASTFLTSLSLEANIWISCFFVYQNNFETSDSRFLKNVALNGIKL